MSKITTRSLFFYGHLVTLGNRALDFSEGGAEILANLRVGDYSATEFAAEVARTLNEFGALTYTVTLNRATRKLTISASGNFELLTNSGSRPGIAIWALLGMATAADKTGAASYVADSETGSAYETQYPVDKYVSPAHSIVFENANYNVTPVGVANQISFGDGRRIGMNIRLISNEVPTSTRCQPGFLINAQGITDFMTFIRYAMGKAKIEFMEDRDTPGTLFKVLLESTAEDRGARSFELKNMKTPNYYESGDLVFREVLI